MSTDSTKPRASSVRCLSPAGVHRMAYVEWGDPANPDVVVCVHGLTRTGRDFDRLARHLAPRYRVVCPDIAGRGRSGWLPAAAMYAVPQYMADCMTLVARLGVDTLDWVGTSMGGLIGMGLAAQADTPIRRLVLNDVGPALGQKGLDRIGGYAGNTMSFDSFEAGVAHVAALSKTFGPLTLDEWRELCAYMIVPRDGRWVLHYDPKIGEATRELVRTGAVATAWPLWDAIRCPTLLLRGAESDLLDDDVATQMTQRGPRARRIDYAGIGHAPSLIHADQISDVTAFLDEGRVRAAAPPA